MDKVDRESKLWEYMTSEVRDLIEDGEVLLAFISKYRDHEGISDYSFLVFPFAKAYEGFCKKFFLDLDAISMDDYYGEDIRIGRLLSPRYKNDDGVTLVQMCKKLNGNNNLAKKMWEVWKRGRNLVFHYFPHNFRRLTFEEAEEVISEIIETMVMCVDSCKLV